MCVCIELMILFIKTELRKNSTLLKQNWRKKESKKAEKNERRKRKRERKKRKE